jgi:aryl-alcohol dehydrogenase-like predicted oxidoreductase
VEYQKLGKTNLKISRIGFGGLTIAGFHYGKTKKKESIQAIKESVKLGINFFDTADIYGFGKSEKILAEGLSASRKKVVIATKVGVRWDKVKNKGYYDISPDYIKKAMEKSARNLKIDTIPLYQIHYRDEKTKPSLTMAVLNDLKAKKRIRAIGCSNFTMADVKEYQKYGRIESIQLPYNIIDQKFKRIISQISKKWKMSVITYSCLAQGLLTGKYESVSFSKNDRRRSSIYFDKETIRKVQPLLDEMKKIAKSYSKTMTQVALRWILDNPCVSCAIVGVKNIEEVREVSGAANWHLSKGERKKLEMLGKKVL